MKNVFFALVFMLVGTFAFANSEKVENEKSVDFEITIVNISTQLLEGTCVVTYDFYNSEGEVIAQRTYSWTSQNADTCGREAIAFLNFLNSNL